MEAATLTLTAILQAYGKSRSASASGGVVDSVEGRSWSRKDKLTPSCSWSRKSSLQMMYEMRSICCKRFMRRSLARIPSSGTVVGGSVLPALQHSRVLPGWLHLPLWSPPSRACCMHTVGNLLHLPWSPEARQEGWQQQ